MKKTFLILVIIVILALAVFVFKKPSIAPTISVSPTVSPASTETTTPTADRTASPVASQTVTITFANGTATPANITIHVGDTVKFINNDSVPRWPASGVHPTHQICPGFDALRGLQTGESYTFTFNIAKTCPWHDHLQPSLSGQIVVSP